MWRYEEQLTLDETLQLYGFDMDYVKHHFVEGDMIYVLLGDSNQILHSFLKRGQCYIDIRGRTFFLEDVLDGFLEEENFPIFLTFTSLGEYQEEMKRRIST